MHVRPYLGLYFQHSLVNSLRIVFQVTHATAFHTFHRVPVVEPQQNHCQAEDHQAHRPHRHLTALLTAASTPLSLHLVQ